MCGIAGILGIRAREDGVARTQRMISALHHRGPDGNAVDAVPAMGGRTLFLGHARLAILDLTDNSAQPMADDATGSRLVYNGEIYNFAELRDDLAKLGHRFRSTGDTEVLLKALIEWGPAVMRRLRGMYAFAFWDGRTRQLILGRDAFGIKPLLIARQGASVLFASELRGLLASGAMDFTYNPIAIRSYLAFGSIIEPATAFEQAVSVPAGHIVVVDDAGHLRPPLRMVSIEDFAPEAMGSRGGSFADSVNAIEGLLQRSVREHLISDVPIGVFLSGGIDSSLLSILADRSGLSQDLRYLTICFQDEQLSELGYARQVAKQLSGEHTAIRLSSGQMLEHLPRALASMDQPTVDGINTYVISNVAAEQGIKVVISGLGGDELFGGYTTFWKAPLLARHHNLLSWLARAAPRRLFGSEIERIKLVHAGECFDVRDAYLLQRSVRWGESAEAVTGDLSLGTGIVPPETWDAMDSRDDFNDFVQISYFESMFYMRNQLLRDGDVMSSANSVELRVPYLDLEILRAAWAVPSSQHRSSLRGGKEILKEILRKLRPDLPVERRKMGFVFPWHVWLKEPSVHAMISEVVHDDGSYANLDIEPRHARRTLDAFTRGEPGTDWSHVWSLFVLLNWNGRNMRSLAAA